MDKLTNQQVLEKLQAQFSDKILHVAEPKGLLTIVTDKTNIIDVLRLLKEDNSLQFIYLTDITAVHYPELEKAFAVVYHVHSLIFNVRIRIKVFLDKQSLSRSEEHTSELQSRENLV